MSKRKIKIFQTNPFSKKIKKLSEKTDLDIAVKEIVDNPHIGQEKKVSF